MGDNETLNSTGLEMFGLHVKCNCSKVLAAPFWKVWGFISLQTHKPTPVFKAIKVIFTQEYTCTAGLITLVTQQDGHD